MSFFAEEKDIQTIRKISLPQENEYEETYDFFIAISTILAKNQEFSVLKVHTNFLGYKDSKVRSKWTDMLLKQGLRGFVPPSGPGVTSKDVLQARKLAIHDAKKQCGPSYNLGTCVDAAKGKGLADQINYWLCYSFNPNIADDNTYFEELEGQTANFPVEQGTGAAKVWGNNYWHSVLVKFHDQQVNFLSHFSIHVSNILFYLGICL